MSQYYAKNYDPFKPSTMSVAPCSYNKILNNIAQSSIEIAGESIDKASRNLISMCRSDDENNEIHLKIIKVM